MLIIGNKFDLAHKRAVNKEEGEQFAKEKMASAGTAQNVEEVTLIPCNSFFFSPSCYSGCITWIVLPSFACLYVHCLISHTTGVHNDCCQDPPDHLENGVFDESKEVISLNNLELDLILWCSNP